MTWRAQRRSWITKNGRARRGTTNKNSSGNSYDRRRRRAWLIERCGVARKRDGEKTRIPCHHCHKLKRANAPTWEVDRYPICGHAGGRYTRDNIVPACPKCNRDRCAKVCRVGAASS